MNVDPLALLSDPAWLEELAREYGFRKPDLDEPLLDYERTLLRHVAEVNESRAA